MPSRGHRWPPQQEWTLLSYSVSLHLPITQAEYSRPEVHLDLISEQSCGPDMQYSGGFVCVCVCVCVRALVRACVRACVLACVRVYMTLSSGERNHRLMPLLQGKLAGPF